MIGPVHRARSVARLLVVVAERAPGVRRGEKGDAMFGRLAVAAIIVLALVWPRPATAEMVELNGGEDRKSVVKGKSVNHGGSAINKKKNKNAIGDRQRPGTGTKFVDRIGSKYLARISMRGDVS